ncbi:unnamed protein product [Closterium sp. Yama58-4]|nr:unnamed protein product [Closterium sp. Yama58-4]
MDDGGKEARAKERGRSTKTSAAGMRMMLTQRQVGEERSTRRAMGRGNEGDGRGKTGRPGGGGGGSEVDGRGKARSTGGGKRGRRVGESKVDWRGKARLTGNGKRGRREGGSEGRQRERKRRTGEARTTSGESKVGKALRSPALSIFSVLHTRI